MYKSLAFVSLVASAVWAQGTSPLIPSGISEKCTSFLNKLNNDNNLSTCTSALSNATATFAPNSDANKNPSSAKVSSTLESLCSPAVTNKCSSDLFGGMIADFYSACSAELTSNRNADVLRLYDELYSLNPFMVAVCSKDDGGNYCATQTKLPDSNDDKDLIQKIIAIPSSNYNTPLLTPNITTFNALALPFLFLKPTTPNLCNVCTRKILNAYLTSESKAPYGPGLAQSSLLSFQSQLYSHILDTCGSNFLSEAGVVKAAGGLSAGPTSSAVRAVVSHTHSFAAGMGVLAVLVSLIL
jgi:hypothetical protein